MANEDPVQDELERLRRVQTYIARGGQCVGFVWNQWSTEARAAIMEKVDGSFGLDDLIVEWAEEFDRMWEERQAIVHNTMLPGGDDFPDQILNFFNGKIHALMAQARLTQ